MNSCSALCYKLPYNKSNTDLWGSFPVLPLRAVPPYGHLVEPNWPAICCGLKVPNILGRLLNCIFIKGRSTELTHLKKQQPIPNIITNEGCGQQEEDIYAKCCCSLQILSARRHLICLSVSFAFLYFRDK